MSYDNTNSGMLSRNDRKEQDNHPDFKGTINVEGVEYWLSGWTKEGKPGSKMEGKKYFSLAVKAKDEKPTAKPVQKQAEKSSKDFSDFDGSIPF